MAKGDLVDFLTRIGKDPKARAAFKSDPHSAMEKAGLSPAQMAAVLSKNPAVIHNAVVDSLGKKAQAMEDAHIVVVVVL